MQDLYRPSLSMLYRILRYSSGETADGNPGTDPGMGTDRGQTRPSTRCKKRTLGQGRSVPGCNGSRYSRTPDHTGGGVQVTLFSPSRKRLQSGPERSRARPTGAAKRTLDGEDRFEMIEKGETARGIPATSVTKSASIGAIDRDPLHHAIHSRRRLPLQAVVAAAQQINTDVVQQGCEPYFRVLPGCLSHTVQPAWLAFPSLRPVRVGLFHVLLGQRPSLHGLLRPSPAFVRPLRRYYAAVRLPAAVPLGLIAHRLLPAFPVLPSTDGRGASRFSRVKFLCMRGVFDSAGPDALALARTSVLPSALLDAVGTLIFAISELTTSGYPACICPCPTLQVRP